MKYYREQFEYELENGKKIVNYRSRPLDGINLNKLSTTILHFLEENTYGKYTSWIGEIDDTP